MRRFLWQTEGILLGLYGCYDSYTTLLDVQVFSAGAAVPSLEELLQLDAARKEPCRQGAVPDATPVYAQHRVTLRVPEPPERR